MSLTNASVPNILLGSNVSYMTSARGIRVFDNRMYVGAYYDENMSFIYNSFSTLTSNQVPDVVLADGPPDPSGNSLFNDSHYDFDMMGTGLLMTNRFADGFFDPDDNPEFPCNDILYYSTPPTSNFQKPDKVFCTSGEGGPESLTYGNAFFVGDSDNPIVYGFRDLANAPSGTVPDIFLADLDSDHMLHMEIVPR